MYDPTIGRWLSEDPIGFTAGDSNLYRYVGNMPTMAVDPSGLMLTRGTNSARGSAHFVADAIGENTVGLVLGLFVNIYDRNRVLMRIPREDPRRLPQIPNNWTRELVVAGQNISGVIPANTVMGVHGCGPCVGLILIPPSPDLPAYAYHFGAMDHPADTLQRDFGTRLSRRVSITGYRAIICGAQHTASSVVAKETGRTINNVIFGVGELLGLRISAYIAGPGAAIDRNGNIYSPASANWNYEGY